MSQLDFTAADDVLNACRVSAAGAALALGRCFGGTWEVAPEEAVATQGEAPPSLNGPGLILLFKLAEGAAVLFWPESTGLLPPWYTENDPATRSTLQALALELGQMLLPEIQTPVDCTALSIGDLAAAWTDGRMSAEGGALPLTLTTEGATAQVELVWLATAPNEMQAEPSIAPASAAPPSPSFTAPPPEEPTREEFEESLAHLPPYMRSLLRVKVQVRVALASTRQPVRRIVEIGPGSIIQFTKRCDDPLSLCVDEQEIAVGEAVKVGDKFGLRVSSMVLPRERFVPLGRTR